VAEKAGWDPANRGQKLGLIWKTKRKSAQIISDDQCLSVSYFILWRWVVAVTNF
jgi:hypothetical protein